MFFIIKQTWYFFIFLLKNFFRHKKDNEYALYSRKYIKLSELYRLKIKNCNSSTLLGTKISITNSFWHLYSLKEIFSEDIYLFKADNPTPFILDCGSNIGLSVIYFKHLFPRAEIVAFEPDPHIYNILKNNLQAFKYDDVVAKNKAIWTEETTLTFSCDGNLGGKLNDSGTTKATQQTVKVPTERLRNYLNKRTDFLKIDIEGPEVDVLEDCADLLKNVQHIFVEYHSEPANEQRLDVLLLILKNAGFKVYIRQAWSNLASPYLKPNYQVIYDMQLNIFGYRVE